LTRQLAPSNRPNQPSHNLINQRLKINLKHLMSPCLKRRQWTFSSSGNHLPKALQKTTSKNPKSSKRPSPRSQWRISSRHPLTHTTRRRTLIHLSIHQLCSIRVLSTRPVAGTAGNGEETVVDSGPTGGQAVAEEEKSSLSLKWSIRTPLAFTSSTSSMPQSKTKLK